MTEFFHTILTQPLLNALIWLHNIIPGNDIGWAIIAITILIRLILYPTFRKQIHSQREMQKLQPKLSEIKEKHKGDKAAIQKATMEFYQQNKINPLSSCLPLLVQLPIFIALFSVLRTSLNGEVVSSLYPFVVDPGVINTKFLGLVDLSESSIVLAVIAGGFQFIQSKMMAPPKLKGEDKAASLMNKQLVYMFPVVTVFIAASLPAGLALYWVVTTLFAVGQQYYIMKGD